VLNYDSGSKGSVAYRSLAAEIAARYGLVGLQKEGAK
jgi:hypothetical protein